MLLPYLSSPTTPPEAPPAARWYVDAGALYQRYAQFETVWGRGRQSVYSVLPFQLRLGHRYRDGSVLYVGVQYRYRQAPITLLQTYEALPNRYYWQTTRRVATLAFPVACGWPIAPRRLAATPWRLELRAGATLLSTRYRLREYSTTTNDPTPYEPPAEKRAGLADIPLTAGCRIGYVLGRRFELTADAGASYSPLVLLSTAFGGETSPWSGGGALSMRYRF